MSTVVSLLPVRLTHLQFPLEDAMAELHSFRDVGEKVVRLIVSVKYIST